MSLTIVFFEHGDESEELDGDTLSSIPGFFTFVGILGQSFRALEASSQGRGNPMKEGSIRRMREYLTKHPEADSQFRGYIDNARTILEREGVPSDISGYDPEARKLAASLMLREEAITGSEAAEILDFVPWLFGYTKSRLLVTPLGQKAQEQIRSILEKFQRCLDVAAESDIAFKIDY